MLFPFYKLQFVAINGSTWINYKTSSVSRTGLTPRKGAISQGLKKIRNERIAFVLRTARRSRGWDDQVKWVKRGWGQANFSSYHTLSVKAKQKYSLISGWSESSVLCYHCAKYIDKTFRSVLKVEDDYEYEITGSPESQQHNGSQICKDLYGNLS